MIDLTKEYPLMNGADLAYLGDAYYELQIRTYLLSKGITKNKELKEKSTLYVSAHAHKVICEKLLPFLTEEELNIYKRGRNGAPHNRRKNIDYTEYTISSGFEAVIGYLYLANNTKRLDEIINKAIRIIEGE